MIHGDGAHYDGKWYLKSEFKVIFEKMDQKVLIKSFTHLNKHLPVLFIGENRILLAKMSGLLAKNDLYWRLGNSR